MIERDPCAAIGCDKCCRDNSVTISSVPEQEAMTAPNVTFFDPSPLDDGKRLAARFDRSCPNYCNGCTIHEKTYYLKACRTYEFGGAACDRRRAEYDLPPVSSLQAEVQ